MGAADGAYGLIAHKIAVLLADRERGSKGKVGQPVIFGDHAHYLGGTLPVGQRLLCKHVEHRTRGVHSLEVVLSVQRLEKIVRKVHRHIGAVGIIRRAVPRCGYDIGITGLILPGHAVGGGFGGRRFEVIQVPGANLIGLYAFEHVPEHFPGKALGTKVGKAFAEP